MKMGSRRIDILQKIEDVVTFGLGIIASQKHIAQNGKATLYKQLFYVIKMNYVKQLKFSKLSYYNIATKDYFGKNLGSG